MVFIPTWASISVGVATHCLTHGQCSAHIRTRLQPPNIALEPAAQGESNAPRLSANR
jgi:hypothetical protein